jgi:type IV secretion system protein VirD4
VLDILAGFEKTGDRELSSIFSTASGVLSAYNSQAALDACTDPNFDVASFVVSADTVYVTVSGPLQTRMAPLVVGLLEEIRDACYVRERRSPRSHPSVLWALDEAANIAPIHSLPAIVSEGGGQGLHVMACFQDLAQARERWGAQATGFLSLFGTKIVFAGIGDVETLKAISTIVGTWDRPYTSISETWTRDPSFFPSSSPTQSTSVSGSSQREAILSEGEIANIPRGCGLLLAPNQWSLLELTPFFSTAFWINVVNNSGGELRQLPDSSTEFQ